MKTKKEVKEYTQGLIKTLKSVRSMRVQSPESYVYFKELLKGHPENPEKTSKMTDLKIVRNKLGKGYTLMMVNKDGTEEDISWNKCIYGDFNSNYLYIAMRSAVYEQINEYRKKNKWECELCRVIGNKEGYHVDHVNYFEQLKACFLRNRTDIPETFDTNEYHQKCFREEDIKFQKEWEEYHKKNAVLRILCKKCNETRSNWDGKESI